MEEETVSMKQKRMEFEFEKATFNKQTEFAKNLLKRQDEEVKVRLFLQNQNRGVAGKTRHIHNY